LNFTRLAAADLGYHALEAGDYPAALDVRMARMNTDFGSIAQRYRTFAQIEAKGRCPLYEVFATAISEDEAVLHFIAALPTPKQQPNLLLAAMQFLYGTAADWTTFRERLLAHCDEVTTVMMTHATQTNEPARCATLLPLLSRLPQPLALIEVGASAGLCLLLDRYSYDFNGKHLSPVNSSTDAPLFKCDVNAATPVPDELPQIIWRAGLDLNPINPRNTEETRWLEALVWPGEGLRLEGLRAALKIAAADPPRVVQGDLRSELNALAAQAPRGVPLVVFHTAVLNYVQAAVDREAFAKTLLGLEAIWICNEGAGLFPGILNQAPKPWPNNKMLMALNGRPIAWADPHGANLDWFGPLSPHINFERA
jgi:hypothetical protein